MADDQELTQWQMTATAVYEQALMQSMNETRFHTAMASKMLACAGDEADRGNNPDAVQRMNYFLGCAQVHATMAHHEHTKEMR